MVYCLERDMQSCTFPVFYQPLHNGGGKLFIEHIFSKPMFLDEHKDCKSVLEVCSGPGFIGWYLYNKLKMESVNFLDIHAPVEEDLKMTGEYNNIDFHFSLSDGFKNYTGPKVDLIVMNPPYYVTDEAFDNHIKYMNLKEDQIEHARRITFDKDGELHNNFIENFEKHLTPNGRMVFLEDSRFYPKDNFKNKVPHLCSQFEQFYINQAEGDYYTLTYFK